MKIEPRERKQSSDFILDNAAALNLGQLFLGWGKKKKRRHLATDKVKAQKKEAAPKDARKKKSNPRSTRQSTKISKKLTAENENEVFVCFVNGETVNVSVSEKSTVADLKLKICREFPKADPNPIFFANSGVLQPEGKLLTHFGVESGSVVYCLQN